MSQTKRGMVPSWVAPFLQSLRDGIAVAAACEGVGIGAYKYKANILQNIEMLD